MSLVSPRLLSTGALFGALALAAACDTQAGDEYQGETLAKLQGVVTNDLDELPPELEAVLVWENVSGEGDFVVGETAVVDGEFPSSFKLEVLLPPGDFALNDFTSEGGAPEARIGIAYLMALPAGEDVAEAAANAVGVSEQYVLIYAESDVAEGTAAAELVGGPLAAGFHLMEVIDSEDPSCTREELFDCLRPAADGFETSIEIRLDELELLDIPNWT